MAYDSLSISEMIPARPERIYDAWLSSDEHSAFTGDKAVVEPYVGGKHSTFDGYAVGQTVELQPGRRIVQTWRAEDFPIGSPDSRVEVTLEETVGGTMLTILHTEIPNGQGSHYRDGWLKYYLEPLKGYFVTTAPRTNGVPKQAPKVKTTVVVKARPQAPTAKPKAKVAAKPKTRSKAQAKAKPKTKAKVVAKPKTKAKAKAKRPAAKRANRRASRKPLKRSR